MSLPAFTAHASLYRTSARYRTAGAATDRSDDRTPSSDRSVTAAYTPGSRTQDRCSGCTAYCVAARNVCLGKVAFSVAQSCVGTLGFGCGGAIAWGVVEAGGCYAHYAECFGLCQIPSVSEVDWESPCCPKVCGLHIPGIAGSGCCDHGEACVGAHNPNTRDGCCPVGQECGGNCCAPGEYCLPGGICSTEPGYFENTYPPPPPGPPNNCLFGGEPCGRKCCLGGQVCCYDADGPTCKTSCLR